MTTPKTIGAPPQRETCETCRYFQRYDRGDYGQCRFNAPIIVSDHEGTETLWPEVHVDHWCGQWRKSLESSPPPV